MALLIGAGLLMHSFLKLATVDPGFDARGVLNFELVVPNGATAERKLEVAQAPPAACKASRVIAAGFTDIPPVAGDLTISMGAFVPEGMTGAEMMEAEKYPSAAAHPDAHRKLRLSARTWRAACRGHLARRRTEPQLFYRPR